MSWRPCIAAPLFCVGDGLSWPHRWAKLDVRNQLVKSPPRSHNHRMEFPGLNLPALDRARRSRDARFDGKFFIAVTSTGIYCRPICPVRSPKACHIRYYPTAASAAEAGFRPCLRCRPEAAPGTPAWLGTFGLVRRGLRLIEDGFLDEHSVERLAARLGVGTRHMHRLFVQHIGASPIVVAQTRRLQFAKRLLDETNLPITSIALASGFGSVRRCNDVFRETYNRSPREMRKGRSSQPNACDEVTLKLTYRPPYDWAHFCQFLGERAIPGVERVESDRYARLLCMPDGPVVIQVRQLVLEHRLELHISGAKPASLLKVSATARRVFDLAADPATIVSAFKPHAALRPLISLCPGLRIPGVWDPFEAAVRAIVGQQITLSSGVTILARLAERFGSRTASPALGLSRLFPTPEQLRDANLSDLGLTSARARALKELASAVCDRSVVFNDDVENVVRALIQVPGIANWSAQYVALRGLGDPDAFPSSELILRRMASDQKPMMSPAGLEKMAESWRPWRGYAAMHLWHASTRARTSRDLLKSR